mgnify:CR=1 FL=1
MNDSITDAVHKHMEELACSDRLSEVDKRVLQWEKNVKSVIEEAVSLREPLSING